MVTSTLLVLSSALAAPPTLEQLQGARWSDCADPAAEFAIEGDRYFGDFEGTHRLTLSGRRLVFEDGLLEGHGTSLPGGPHAFHIVEWKPGELVLRREPAIEGTRDWTLRSCDAPEASLAP